MKIVLKRTLVLTAFALGLSLSSYASAAQTEEEIVDKLEDILKIKLPDIPIKRIDKSPMPGVYQVYYNAEILYVSADGQFILNGDLYDISDKLTNLTKSAIEAEYAPARKKGIEELPKGSAISFKAEKEKYQISVFTDVDCGYCRKLHNDVPTLNKMGITVNYLAFPRAGKGSETYKRMASVWCSKDQQDAMTKEKNGKRIEPQTCESHPLDVHMKLVREFGLTGTPAIITEDGRLIPGYLPPHTLLTDLQKKSG
jgi:thiol:disulfide interchange protein DsbC